MTIFPVNTDDDVFSRNTFSNVVKSIVELVHQESTKNEMYDLILRYVTKNGECSTKESIEFMREKSCRELLMSDRDFFLWLACEDNEDVLKAESAWYSLYRNLKSILYYQEYSKPSEETN